MRELPVEQQIAIVRGAGYASICLVSDARFATLDALTVDAPERLRIRRLPDAAGLELSAIAGHANLIEPDEVQRAANRDRLKATIDLAVDLAGPHGAPCVIGMGYGTPDRYEHERQALAEAFGELARHAESRGVVVALEPHVGQAFDLPE